MTPMQMLRERIEKAYSVTNDKLVCDAIEIILTIIDSEMIPMEKEVVMKSSDLEKQVEELLAVTGCKNVREVIEYFDVLKAINILQSK